MLFSVAELYGHFDLSSPPLFLGGPRSPAISFILGGMWFSHRFIRRVKSFPPLVNACHGSTVAFSVSLFVISSSLEFLVSLIAMPQSLSCSVMTRLHDSSSSCSWIWISWTGASCLPGSLDFIVRSSFSLESYCNEYNSFSFATFNLSFSSSSKQLLFQLVKLFKSV